MKKQRDNFILCLFVNFWRFLRFRLEHRTESSPASYVQIAKRSRFSSPTTSYEFDMLQFDPVYFFFAHLLVIFKLLMITRRIMRGFICTFSLSISLSITLLTSEFRNQFTICSTYLDMARYLDQTTTKMTECYRYLAVNKARRELTRSKFG